MYKITSIFLTIILLISVFFNIRQFRISKEDERRYVNYLKGYMREVSNSFKNIENTYNEKGATWNSLTYSLTDSIKALTSLHCFLVDGANFAYRDLNYPINYEIENIIFAIQGKKGNQLNTEAFWLDQKLTEDEYLFIKGLRQEFEEILINLDDADTPVQVTHCLDDLFSNLQIVASDNRNGKSYYDYLE